MIVICVNDRPLRALPVGTPDAELEAAVLEEARAQSRRYRDIGGHAVCWWRGKILIGSVDGNPYLNFHTTIVRTEAPR